MIFARRRRLVGSLSLLLVTWVGSGCAGVSQEIVTGSHFRHVTTQIQRQDQATGPLHIYISGDGRPFLSRTEVASDPSTPNPYVLKLMRQDTQPAVLLGRPCYHGLSRDSGCGPRQWTTHRYSSRVVDSMVATARKLSRGRPSVLIGYSGGGTLAMLMAPQLENIVGVITVAANLDVTAWTRHHEYSALIGSLNPALSFEKTHAIPQMHFFGARDENIPGSMVAGIAESLPNGSVYIVNNYGHTCCWHKNWAELLQQALENLSRFSTTSSYIRSR